VQRNAN